MTVYCEETNWSICEHNEDGVCQLKDIHLVISYGRSTDYSERLTCSDRKQRR